MQVLPCVQNEEPVVRNMAFFCLGSASLLDVNQAQKYFHLLLQASVCVCVCVYVCYRPVTNTHVCMSVCLSVCVSLCITYALSQH